MHAWDPTGEKARAVKRRYQGVCRGCGATTAARGGKGDAYDHCKRCHPGAIAATRTREWVRGSMREWRQRYGSPPSSTDWSRTHALRRGGEALNGCTTGTGRHPQRSSTCTAPRPRLRPSLTSFQRPNRLCACAPSRHATALATGSVVPVRGLGLNPSGSFSVRVAQRPVPVLRLAITRDRALMRSEARSSARAGLRPCWLRAPSDSTRAGAALGSGPVVYKSSRSAGYGTSDAAACRTTFAASDATQKPLWTSSLLSRVTLAR